MDIDIEQGTIGLSGRENEAIGRGLQPAVRPYVYREGLFELIRTRKAYYDSFDASSLPYGALHTQMIREQRLFGPILEGMLQELAPHVDDTGVATGAEAFLRKQN